MAESEGVELTIGLKGFKVSSGGVDARGEQSIRVNLPATVTDEHLEFMRNDLRLLSKALEDDPRTVLEMHNAVLRNDMSTANRLARQVGLTEDHAQSYGGGMWGWILVAGVVIFAYAAFSGPGDDSPPPPPPPVDAGPVNAGPG